VRGEGTSSAGASDNLTDHVLETVAEVSGRLSDTSPTHLTKRFAFLCYEFQAQAVSGFEFQDISKFLFEQNGFRAVDERLCDLKEILLTDVLQTRVGIPMVIGLIFRTMAKRFSKNVCFIRSPDLSILKCKEKDSTHFIDLNKNGKVLDRSEMLELMQSRFRGYDLNKSISFETLDDESVLGIYLTRLCKEYVQRQDDRNALIIYDFLLNLQPKNLTLLRDRSMTYYRLNQLPEALSDLKRYFSFAEPSQQPTELLELYQSLQHNLDLKK
jgi:regulator of sirC expression with transglutaminase-like and TPR domain